MEKSFPGSCLIACLNVSKFIQYSLLVFETICNCLSDKPNHNILYFNNTRRINGMLLPFICTHSPKNENKALKINHYLI
jgi:hypothetical protein